MGELVDIRVQFANANSMYITASRALLLESSQS